MSEPLVIAVPVFSMLANAGFALRREVFVREQKVPQEEEFDADDLTATISSPFPRARSAARSG